MVFSSLEFLYLFLPAVLLCYYIVPPVLRNPVLLLFSLAFYGWGEPIYITLMILTIIVDYVCGYFVGKWRLDKRKAAKIMMITAIFLNLAALGVFKYYDFIILNLRLIPALSSLPLLGLSLPVGISFYTFQSLSYVIDVYRGEAQTQKNVLTFGTYVTLFPQLIAGPIVRYSDVDEQLRSRKHNTALFASGIRTFLCGLGKKVLLANAAGELWEHFSGAGELSVLGSWLGIIFYSFQIYFDFSGYSDMAIGLGKMFGFKFLENFYYPYISESVTDFWRRWHISLGTWFREYVYIPLGGNRVKMPRMYFNIFAVWFLTGLWHGASWNFVLWGLYYCLLLIIEKTFLLRITEKVPRIIKIFFTMLAVLFGWLLFVSTDLTFTAKYLSVMFGVGAAGMNTADLYDLVRLIPFIILLAAASTPFPKRIFYRFWSKYKKARIICSVLCAVLLIITTAYLVNSSYNPFLYFRF